jgi:hypothetical protein
MFGLWIFMSFQTKKASVPFLFVQFGRISFLMGPTQKNHFLPFFDNKPNNGKYNIFYHFSLSSFFPFDFSQTKHNVMIT